MKDEFVVIDITTNGLQEDDAIIGFAALRFENGIPIDRFFEYVNSGAVLSDNVSEILGITNTIQKPVELVIEKKNKSPEPDSSQNGDNNTEKKKDFTRIFYPHKNMND